MFIRLDCEKLTNDKQSSLVQKSVNHRQKKFYNIGSRFHVFWSNIILPTQSCSIYTAMHPLFGNEMFALYVSWHTYVLIKCLWVKQFLTKRSISPFFGQKSFCWNSVWSKKQWPQNSVTKYMYFKSFGIRLTRLCKL